MTPEGRLKQTQRRRKLSRAAKSAVVAATTLTVAVWSYMLLR